LGNDLGGGGALGAGGSVSLLTGGADLDGITKLLAIVNSDGLKAVDGGAAYDAAIAKVQKWNPLKADIDEQAENLRTVYGLI
jgi:hypothetical protein